MNSKLIITIVARNTADLLIQAANQAGAKGGTIIIGTGTSANAALQLLGLGSSGKDLLYTIVDESVENDVISAIKAKFEERKMKSGVIFSINVTDFIKCGVNTKSQFKENTMNENPYTMITAIVNKGYAEDAMAVAREAGAGGGTILAAHGTAKENDAEFFGVKIVPEKDMLLILVPKEKCDNVLQAIQNLECLKQPGSGITFCTDVHNFTVLGKN